MIDWRTLLLQLDFVRGILVNTFAVIRQQNGDALKNHNDITKDSVGDDGKLEHSV